MYLLYTYYKGGRWERLPYFHMLTSMSFLAFMHIVTILCFFSKGEWLLGDRQEALFVRLVSLFAVVAIILSLIGSRKTLEALNYPGSRRRTGYWILIFYAVSSFALMIFSFSIEAKQKHEKDMPTKITPINFESSK